MVIFSFSLKTQVLSKLGETMTLLTVVFVGFLAFFFTTSVANATVLYTRYLRLYLGKTYMEAIAGMEDHDLDIYDLEDLIESKVGRVWSIAARITGWGMFTVIIIAISTKTGNQAFAWLVVASSIVSIIAVFHAFIRINTLNNFGDPDVRFPPLKGATIALAGFIFIMGSYLWYLYFLGLSQIL